MPEPEFDIEDLKFDPESLTWAQAIFLSEKTGRGVEDIKGLLTDGNYTPRDLAAIVAIVKNPNDPEAAYQALLKQRIADFVLK